jgi:hypothetical protein
MLRSVTATVLALCVVSLIGCTKKRSASTHGKGSPPIPIRVLFFDTAEVGRSVKPDGTIDVKSDEFSLADHLFVSVRSNYVPKGLAAHLSVKGPDEKSVLEMRTEFSQATSRGVFAVNDLTKWKPGAYQLEVTLEGDVVFKHGVTIVEPTTPGK